MTSCHSCAARWHEGEALKPQECGSDRRRRADRESSKRNAEYRITPSKHHQALSDPTTTHLPRSNYSGLSGTPKGLPLWATLANATGVGPVGGHSAKCRAPERLRPWIRCTPDNAESACAEAPLLAAPTRSLRVIRHSALRFEPGDRGSKRVHDGEPIYRSLTTQSLAEAKP